MGKTQIIIPILAGCFLGLILRLAQVLYAFYQMEYISNNGTFVLYTMPLGCILGSFVYCFLSETIGRKYAITGLLLPFIISCAIYQFSRSYAMICLASIAMALSSGGAFAVIPIYISEIAEKSSRGMLVSMFYFISVEGPKLVGIILQFVELKVLLSVLSYVFIIMGFALAVTFGIFATESPLYFLRRGREMTANVTLNKLRNVHDAQLELNELQGKTAVNQPNNVANMDRVMPCLRSNVFVKALVITLSLLILQTLSGFHLSGSYVFEFTINEPVKVRHIVQWTNSLLNLMSSVACVCLVDRIGRKMCLLISYSGMAASLVYLCIIRVLYFAEIVDGNFYYYIPYMLLFYSSFSFGAGPIPSIFLGELFSLRSKMVMSALLTVTAIVLQYLSIYIFRSLISFEVDIFINLVVCIAAVIIIHLFYLETKKRSLNEIQLALSRF